MTDCSGFVKTLPKDILFFDEVQTNETNCYETDIYTT